MKIKVITSFAIAAMTMMLFSSCGSDPNSAGLEYMPDMYRSAAIEPYVDYGEIRGRENKEFKNRLSAMTPPYGTIPYYGTDSAEVSLMFPYFRLGNTAMKTSHGMYNEDLTSVDEYALAVNDKNPLLLTEENMESIFESGKKLFGANCAHCHGEKGDGNGQMVKNGLYAGVADYGNLKQLGDGQMFYSIYYGKGMMGAHRSILNKKEIWTLVHYVRKFQFPDYGKPGAEVMPEGASVEENAE